MASACGAVGAGRSYSHLRQCAAPLAGTPLPAATPLPGPAAVRTELSAFEAAFGKPPETTAGPMDLDLGTTLVPLATAATVGGRRPWAELFDAPSHVLPAPAALASAFLSLLTAADG
jgi:hypothetical protein